MKFGKDNVHDRDLMPQLQARLLPFAQKEAAIGILGKDGQKKHPGKAGSRKSGNITIAGVAAVHEFTGIPKQNVPARPFIRPTADKHGDRAQNMLQVGIGKVIDGSLSAEAVYETVGLFLEGKVKDYVSGPTSPPPPLKESTKRRKGSSNPLVDDGHLLNSISSEVRMRKGF